MQKLVALSIIIISVLFFLFSYLWVDLAIVLMLGAIRSVFNNIYPALAFGEANRQLLSLVYLFFLIIIFIVQIYCFKKADKLNSKLFFITAFITTIIFSLSYPLFSHDIYTYLFFSKAAVTYHVNPYQVTPNDFKDIDLWVGFTHSVDGNYRYGIVYLVYTLIPMFILSGSRFILNFLALKLMNALLFFVTGYVLYKIFNQDKRVFSLWFFNPLLIIELLINSHNDLLMVALFIFAMALHITGKRIFSLIVLIASAATKYISIFAAPVLVLNERFRDWFLKASSVTLLYYFVTTNTAVHSWYYTWLFMFLPFIKISKNSFYLVYCLCFLLMVNYASFIKTREWGNSLIIPDVRVVIVLMTIAIIALELKYSGRADSLLKFAKTNFLTSKLKR